jgi:hypothetical protein
LDHSEGRPGPFTSAGWRTKAIRASHPENLGALLADQFP